MTGLTVYMISITAYAVVQAKQLKHLNAGRIKQARSLEWAYLPIGAAVAAGSILAVAGI